MAAQLLPCSRKERDVEGKRGEGRGERGEEGRAEGMAFAHLAVRTAHAALLAALAAHGPGPATPADSTATDRTARRAQEDFERARRNLSPDDLAAPQSCDVIIGRFCYWNGEDETDPPEEPSRVQRARDKLLAVLDRAATVIAGDGWVVGQRVRYLIESGRQEVAVTAAHACRATAWWCEALTGYALHAASDFAQADSAFAVAMHDMPAEERCAWNDVSPLIDGDALAKFATLSCDEREAFVARFWWLAQPLLSEPHNDLRTEHYARLTLAKLLEHSMSPYALPWGPDMQELTIRFGWPTRWSRAAQAVFPIPDVSGPHMRGHDPKHGVDFTPSAHAVVDPASARADDWALTDKHPRARYSPAYAEGFADLPHQLARFRRGDSMLVVVACDPHALADTGLGSSTDEAHERVEGALVLAHDPVTPPQVVQVAGGGKDRAIVLSTTTAQRDTLLMSAELRAPWERRAARTRYALRAPAIDSSSRIAVSDILFFEPSDSMPEDAESAAAHALPQPRVPRGGRVGLYFETYDADSLGADSVGLAITVRGVRRGWLRRIEESLHLAPRASRLAVEWHETAPNAAGAAPRALTLDLATLRPGRYQLELAVTSSGNPPITTTRDLEIAEQ
jgi:hypothetical protein